MEVITAVNMTEVACEYEWLSHRVLNEFSNFGFSRNSSFTPNVLSFFAVVRVNHPLPDFTEATRDTGM